MKVIENWEINKSSVNSKGGVVTSHHYEASDIGADILNSGGNAVDAAVAVGFALTATLPRAGNIGGGGFMLIYDAKNKTIVSLDFRSMSPELATPDVYRKDGLKLYQYLLCKNFALRNFMNYFLLRDLN